MIKSLYPKFQLWAATGSIWIISDTHFEDPDCKIMDPDWITPEEQIKIINQYVYPTDTFIHLGDVGECDPWINQIRAGYKILIMGNHDQGITKYQDYFDEVYSGPLFISDKILLSHEPINVPFALNIHGHDHNSDISFYCYDEDEKICIGLNLAANVCKFNPINLGKCIKKGILSGIQNIHRFTIDKATERKKNDWN